MASIANDRDALLQASTERTVPVGDVSWDTVTGDNKPADNADVTEEAVNAGVTVTSGGMTLEGGGAIKGGQTDFNTGVGFFLGYSGAKYKFSVGDPNGNHIRWDGTTMTLAGSLDFANVVNGPPANADSTSSVISNTLPVFSGGITFLGGGSIKGGQTSYNTGVGFFLGYAGGGYRFSIGDPNYQSMTWNGSVLNIKGLLSGGEITLGVGDTPRGFAFEVNEFGGVYADNMHSALFWALGTVQNSFGSVVGISTYQGAGVYGTTEIYNTWSSANGVVGENYNDGTRGYVGAGNGYDFYAAGAGTNYGPFTGAHDALVPQVSADTFEKGNIVVDKTLIRRNGWSNTIFEVELSTTPNQAGAIGIISSRPRNLDKENPPSAFIMTWVRAAPPPGISGKKIKDHPLRVPLPIPEYKQIRQDYKRINVNAVGEGQLQVCGEGGNINQGDLIVCSSMPGKGMKQSDNIVRNYTVARARESRNFSGPTDVKTVACIYLCG